MWPVMNWSLMEDGACDLPYLQMEIHTMKGKKWGLCFSDKIAGKDLDHAYDVLKNKFGTFLLLDVLFLDWSYWFTFP